MNTIIREIIFEEKTLEEGQTESNIKSIYGILKDNPKVKWKESFKEILGLDMPTEIGLDK